MQFGVPSLETNDSSRMWLLESLYHYSIGPYGPIDHEFGHVHSQIKALHLYDCLRANKATSAWGLEVRVPFLDKEFVDVAMSIDPEWKMVSLNVLVTIL